MYVCLSEREREREPVIKCVWVIIKMIIIIIIIIIRIIKRFKILTNFQECIDIEFINTSKDWISPKVVVIIT